MPSAVKTTSAVLKMMPSEPRRPPMGKTFKSMSYGVSKTVIDKTAGYKARITPKTWKAGSKTTMGGTKVRK